MNINSTFLNDTNIDSNSFTDHARWPGAVMIVYSLACMCAYTLCIMTILTNKETSKSPSYQIILHIGITDLGQLSLNGVVGGIFSLCRTDFNFYLNKAIGGVMNSIWVVSVTMADLLAWNRLLHTYNPSLAKRLFTLRNTRLILATCWLYGLAWIVAYMFPDLDLLYDPFEHNWNYASNDRAQTFSLSEFIQDSIHCASMAACYAAIIFKLVKQARQITNSQLNTDKKEKLVLLQSMWLCVANISAVLLFFFNTSIIPNHWSMFFATMVWLTLAGSNAFIYLIFNKSIRKQVKELMHCGKNTGVVPATSVQGRQTITVASVLEKPRSNAGAKRKRDQIY